MGPYAAWMPREGLHGRTCGVSRDGGRERALQPSSRYTALPLIYHTLQAPIHNAASNRDLERWRRLAAIRGLNQKLGGSRARCPHHFRDTP
ncbi:hypothetical protein XarbCFBP8149_01645 [Xanthomonas arboricola]|nr:hypothetical protein XarbCFBP8149_01645 [Xanthomonas arboricola]